MSENLNVASNLSVASLRADVWSTTRYLPLSLLSFNAGLLFSARTIFALVTARWLNIGTELGVLAGFTFAAGLAAIAMLGAFGVRHHAGYTPWTSRPLRWVILYLTFSGCSLFWTASVSVTSSALYWFSLVGDVSIVILLVRGDGSEQVVDSLLKGYIAGSCALAAIAWMMPTAADLRLGDIDYFNTNQIGNLCALSLLMYSFLVTRGHVVWHIVQWFLGVTLLRSLSKATLAAFIMCLLYRFIRDASIPRRKKWRLASLTVVLTLSFWTLLSAYYDVYTTAGNQAETLTGRTAIWAWTLDAALKKPWLGNGFDAMWKVAPPFGGEQFEARHAENELLQQFFAYGLCGVVLMIGIYGSLYRRIRALPLDAERIALTSFLIYVAIRGLAEAEPFDLLLPLWLVTALALILQQSGRRQATAPSKPSAPASVNAVAGVLKGST
ncbi:MAG TPA: O-antigen ligase family protein [Edaphobacter sp.]|uniref:O-antigen ligase family protein n=1 Tax=Edaphobacter sp. TaxID=1934404 RepID=UPI002C658B58|nr:O-antigen ligase family protein [Edaphobacter sp.]HUZ96371.1 O-antigen ligase family protein [Edaphobacter sp.]